MTSGASVVFVGADRQAHVIANNEIRTTIGTLFTKTSASIDLKIAHHAHILMLEIVAVIYELARKILEPEK